jgi:phosphoglycerol transferase MdoB-like AlkP superfamily enzyme
MLALATMLQWHANRYGFLGMEGVFGIIVGIIILIIICVILFKIAGLLLPKLGLDAAWTQIVYWLLVLLVFLLFLHLLGLY